MKSTILAAAACVAVALAAATASAQPTAMPKAWTSIRLVPSLNAVVSYEGAPRWVYRSKGAFSSSPTIVDGVVYLADNTGMVSALDLKTGRERWRWHANDATKSSPLVVNGIVYVGTGNDDSQTLAPRRVVQVGLRHNALIALNARTGRVIWTTPLRGSGMSTSTIASGLLIHHDGHGDYVALDPATGALRWRRHVGSVNSMSGTATLPNGAVASAGLFPNGVLSLRASDGSVLWRKTFSASHSGFGDCPLAFDGTSVVGTYLARIDRDVDPGVPATHHVYAIRSRDGSLAWDRALESGTTPVRNEAAIPVIVDNVVYDGSAVAPYVHALDARTGRLLWRTKVHGPVKSAPVVVDGNVYVADLAGYLWALDARSGKVVGSLRTGVQYNVGSPVVAGRSLVIGSLQGIVAATPLAEIQRNHDG